MVSHPETGSDSPTGSDRDRGHDNVTLMQILLVLIGKALIVQDPIGSEVTQDVTQIALLVWKVGKHPMLHRFVSKVKQ